MRGLPDHDLCVMEFCSLSALTTSPFVRRRQREVKPTLDRIGLPAGRKVTALILILVQMHPAGLDRAVTPVEAIAGKLDREEAIAIFF